MGIFEDNNNSPFNKVSEFNKNSRAIWEELSSGTPFETEPPTCGPFLEDFYGQSKNEGIDFVELVKFLHKNRVDKSLSFDYKPYRKPATVTYYEHWIDTEYNTIPFSYKDENNIVREAIISGKLNKRNCYLEDSYGYILRIDSKKKQIGATLRFYYENTKQYRQDYTKTLNTNDFTIDEKYVAISLSSINLNDFVHLVKTIQGESSFTRIKNTITKKYAKLLNEVKDSSEVNYLYKNAPNFVLKELNKHIKKEQFFDHLDLLVKYDTEGVFSGWVDSSSSIVNLFKAIGNAEYLFEKFKDDPTLVKNIYWNLDGSSKVTIGFEDNAQEIEKRNRTIFSEFILGLCYHNKHYKALKTKENTYFVGENYKFKSNVIRANDTEKDKFFLQQEVGRKEIETITIPDDLSRFRERHKVEVTKFYPENKGAYYHPLDLVFLIDADSGNNVPMPVPIIYLKSISDEEEWKGINLSIRIGADILAIILGVATLGTSSPLLLAAAAIDIGLATTDLLVAVSEDALMKTPEGQQFLEDWNKVSLYLGVGVGVTAIAAFRNTIVNGARLLAKATLETTQKFLRTALLKLVLEINISNFAKGTIKIIPYGEVSTVTKNVLSSSSTIKLQNVGVIFAEGEQVANKTTQGIAATYKGEVIAQGTAKEVQSVIDDLAKLKGDDLLKTLDDLFERANLLGRILKTEDELKLFLGKIDKTFKAIELEKVGIKSFFRGTTKNSDGSFFQGNQSSKLGLSITTDPVRAIIFAIESATESKSKGFLQIGLTKELNNISLNVPATRTRYLIELEIKLQTNVNNLSKLVKTIPVEKARVYINKRLNLDLGTKIYSRESFMLLNELPVTSLEESLKIYQELIKL